MNRQTPMTKADDVRETPPELFDKLNAEFDFTLDACATHENAKCARYYTESGLYVWRGPSPRILRSGTDGLRGWWKGERVFVNPPFSDIPAWVDKAWESGAELVVMLVPATRTEQPWWQDLVEPYRDCDMLINPFYWRRLSTRFLRKRTRFLKDGKPMGSPKFGCVLLIWSR